MRRRSLLAAGLTVPLGLLTALDDALASVPAPAATGTADIALCLSRARRLFDTGDLAGLVADLPQLMAIAHVRAEQTQHPADYARSAACYDLATEALNKIGHLAASRITADRSMICARLSGSPIATAASARCLSIVLRHEGREQIADRITLDAAVTLQRTGLITSAEAAAYAQMLCTCAYTAAQAGDRDRALEMIADAEGAVIRLPALRQGQPFNVSAAHVALYRVGVHWSLGDAGAAVNVGSRLHPGQFPTPERRGRLFTDLARAWWLWGKPEQTVQALLTAHSYAPAEVRDRPSIRKVVTDVARRHPNVSGVRELTAAVGLWTRSLLTLRPAHKHTGRNTRQIRPHLGTSTHGLRGGEVTGPARRVRAYRFKELFGYQVLNAQRRERIEQLMAEAGIEVRAATAMARSVRRTRLACRPGWAWAGRDPGHSKASRNEPSRVLGSGAGS